jgi:TP901 family phage tail tape measure protein
MADFANLVLGVDTSGLKRGERDLKQFGAQGERTERKIDKFGGAASRSLGAVALAATAALSAFISLGSAVRIIADFETSMSRLGAVSRATASELEALRDIAKDLGSTTEFSASQAADGLNFLAMAGFNATEAMAAIPSVLDLATASGMGLAEAADTASNIMSGFGIAASDAAQVADVLAAASTRANTTVGQLGAAMATVAPIASALDISLEDTAAAIGVLSDAGIQADRAGTALRGVLASLAGPTSQAESVIRGLGLTIADVDPATNNLSVVMSRLGAAGLSTADAMTLFGREAASGALVLIDGAQRVGQFGDELERADGAAGDMAATMRDNLGGDLKGAASAAQGLAIALGDAGLTAIIRGLVQAVAALVRGITGLVDGFAKMSAGVANLFGFASANEEIARTASVAALAIEQEVLQADKLLVGLIEGRSYSVDYVGVKLAQAAAHLATADAIRQENIAAVKNTQTFIDAAERQAAFNDDLQSYYRFRAEAAAQGEIEGAADAERFRVITENIRDAYNVQLELLGAVSDTSPEVAALQAEIDYINTLLDGSVDGVVMVEGGLRNAAVAASGLTAELAASLKLMARMDALGPQQSSAGRGRGGDPRDFGGGFLGQGLQEADAFIASLDDIEKASKSASDASAVAAKAMRDQISALEDAADPLRVYTRELAKLDKLKLQGLSDGAYAAAVKALTKELEEATNSATSFANTFQDGITDALDYVLDGMKSGMDGLMDIFKRTLMDMIKFALTNPINLQGGMNMGGGGMMSSLMGGGGGGGGGMLSSVGMGGGIAGSFMSGGAGLLTSLTGAGGGLASAGTYMSAVMSGATASLGGAAAALGAVALPLAAVFAVVSFFRSKTKTIDSGIKGIISMEDAAFESFKEIEKSRFFGLSKKRSTSFNTLTGDDSAPLDAAVFAVRESVIGATESLGVSIDVFNGFTHDFTLSLKGLDDAARTAAITEEFARMGDSMAGLVPHIADMNQLFAVAANRVGLMDRLLQAQGNTEELTARIRGREMDATNELNKALLAQVFAAEDAAAAAQSAANAISTLTASINENAFATGVDFRRGLSRASNGIQTTPQQSQAEMLAELKALNARIDVLQSTSEITANSSSQTAENTDYSNALTLDAAT